MDILVYLSYLNIKYMAKAKLTSVVFNFNDGVTVQWERNETPMEIGGRTFNVWYKVTVLGLGVGKTTIFRSSFNPNMSNSEMLIWQAKTETPKN